MCLLRAENITIHFGGLKAVDGVNLHVNKGEIVSLIGPNGAGKTTFFNIISGIYNVTGGSVMLEGERIDGIPPEVIIRKGIARTFQNIRLFGQMTVLENVLVGMHTRSSNGLLHTVLRTRKFYGEESNCLEKARELLGSVNLSHKQTDSAKNLAYGEQRKLEIVRALASGPKVLLLDEPAAGMNTQETKELISYIQRLRNAGVTILLIEHDMKLVMKISDRIYVLDHGANIADGCPADVQKNKAVIEAYLGKGA